MSDLLTSTSMDALTPVELENRRRALVAKAEGNFDNLTPQDLHELAVIASQLRKRTSGPPKVAKAPKVGKTPLSTTDITNLI